MKDSTRIVVINDDVVQLRLLERVLEGAGYAVDDYAGAARAMTALGEGPRVDLFIVDLHMPGIDGWKVCRLLRSPDLHRYNTTPILVVSATFTGADVEAITRDLGADAFLALPFSREELLEDVAALLRGRRPQPRLRALLVEDDELIGLAATRSFQAIGYEVYRASTLEAAALLWVKVVPDVVVLDYHLPDGSSLDLLTRLQSPADRTVVIFMTGDADPKLPVRLLGHGADGFVRKPFDPEILIELTAKAQRQRALLRVEALLERRTQELRASELRYRSLFEAIPDLVVALDTSDRIAQAGGGAVTAMGCHDHDLLQRDVLDLVPSDEVDHVRHALQEVRRTGRGRFETRLLRSDGDPLNIEVTAAAVFGADDQSVLVVARDLTERRKAEEERRTLDQQVQHAQRLESLGVLAGGIAHDFNNLLVGMLGNASLALLDVEEGGSVYECVTQIEIAARRAAELTQQILTFSGKGDSVMAPHDLTAVVAEMGQLLAPAVSKKADLAYRLADGLPLVEVDVSQIRQVVMNVIMNASDALEGGAGRIEVSTSLQSISAEEVPHYYLSEQGKAGSYVVLEVIDDGCGMDTVTQQRIFDPFFTTKFAGRGLGLASTLGIVRSHRGLLSVDSAPREGTRFRILLPAVGGPPPERPADRWSATPIWKGGGSILVIDDEPAVRHLAVACLTRAGFSVTQAADGAEGLALIETGPRPDLVLVDLTMPVMGGVEFLEAVRRRHPRLPLILSSGFSADSIPLEDLERDGGVFLRKPYSPTDLLEAVRGLLGSPPPPAPTP